MSVPRYLLPSKKMMFEIPNPESARSIVQNIFERPGDAIIDTCALLAVKSYMIRQVIQLQKSVESDLETAIAFLDEFNTNLPLHKNRILIFPELSKEYERIVNILNIAAEKPDGLSNWPKYTVKMQNSTLSQNNSKTFCSILTKDLNGRMRIQQ